MRFVKGYKFLSYIMGKSVGKNANQKLSDKYSHKLLDHAKQSAADTIKTPSKNGNSKRIRRNW